MAQFKEFLKSFKNKILRDVQSEVLCLDSTSIKVHPDAAGAKKTSGEQSIGRSKGG